MGRDCYKGLVQQITESLLADMGMTLGDAELQQALQMVDHIYDSCATAAGGTPSRRRALAASRKLLASPLVAVHVHRAARAAAEAAAGPQRPRLPLA